jgi:hypothetical protein
MFSTEYFDEARTQTMMREICICVRKEFVKQFEVKLIDPKFQNGLHSYCVAQLANEGDEPSQDVFNELKKNSIRAQVLLLSVITFSIA